MIASLRAHLRDPANHNAYALVLTALVTSGLGFLYWVVAARNYDEADVGVSAALVSTMMLVARAAQVGLGNGLVRFVPAAGAGTGRLVLRSFGLAAGIAALLGSVVAVAWLPHVDQLDRVGPTATVGLWFVAACVVWVLFVLQDSVLTGMRMARWVLVENATYGVVKLALLAVLAAAGWRSGVFASWTAPLVALLVPVQLAIFVRARAAKRTAAPEASADGAAGIARFAGADFLATILWELATLGMPLVVLTRAGGEANAHYYVAWSCAYLLFLVVSNVSQSFVVEAVHDPARTEVLARRAVQQAGVLVVPAALVAAVGAPWFLHLFGGAYAEGGATALRLMALAAVPYVVIGCYVGLARVTQDLRRVVAIYGALSAGVLVLGTIGLEQRGIAGVGAAWLGVTTTVAAALLLRDLARGWIPILGAGPPAALLALRRRAIGAARNRAAAVPLSALRLPEHLRGEVLDVATTHGVHRAVIATATGHRVVVRAAPVGHTRSVEVNQAALERVAALEGFRSVAPSVLAAGTDAGLRYTVETWVPGTAADRHEAAGHPADLARLGAAFLAGLHTTTASAVEVGDAQLAAWVRGPCLLARSALRTHAPTRPLLDRLEALLVDRLARTTVHAAWVHGDLAPGNVLLDPSGSVVTGLVDWERSDPCSPPEFDTWHLALTAACGPGHELGDVVCEHLEAPSAAALPAGPNDLPHPVMLLLVWLHHVASNLEKDPAYRRNGLWVARNIDAVLYAATRTFDRLPADQPA